jgi:hypothetical protein
MTRTLEEPEKPAEPAQGKGRGPNLAALTDGLRAETYPLPHETDAAAERAAKWHNYYNPQSPAAIHLANECARATIVADRAEKFRQARIERQKADVPRNWRRRRKRRLDKAVKRMDEDHLGTYYELASFSDGCRELAYVFRETVDCVRSRGYLLAEELEKVIYFHGIWPVADVIQIDVTAYTFHTLNLACTPGVTPEQLDAWIEPANRPAELRSRSRDELIPGDQQRCRERLVEHLKGQEDKFWREEERMRREDDEPELRHLLEEAETLDEKAARKVNRSHAEARTTFHRALKDLCKTLPADAKEDNGSTCNKNFSDLRVSDGREEEAAAPQPLSPWERVPEGRVRAAAPPSAGAALSAEEDEAGALNRPPHPGPPSRGRREEDGLPNDPETPSEAPSQRVEAKDDSTNDQGSSAAVPPGSLSAPQEACGNPVLKAEATAGSGVLLVLLAMLLGQLLGALGWVKAWADAVDVERPRAASAPVVRWASPATSPGNWWALRTLQDLERRDR